MVVCLNCQHMAPLPVSDLVRGRPIWFGGTDRSEKSLDLFFQWRGPRKCKGIRLAVMDMWKPFRNSTLKAGNAPQAGILYDLDKTPGRVQGPAPKPGQHNEEIFAELGLAKRKVS